MNSAPTPWPTEARFEALLAERPGEIVARAEVAGEPVALRILSSGRRGLTNELDALERLQSPLIPRIVGRGVLEDGSIWFAREWIIGSTLAERAASAAAEEVGAAIVDVLRGLAVVHGAGIVHGDISPANVLIEATGRGRLTDFGMAGVEDGSGQRGGTPPYIAPEVLVGDAPVIASDLFSVGAVLAVALSGARVEPASFYGRFPGEPFLECAGIDLADLPVWSRGTIAQLTALTPSERPMDAMIAAAELAGQLGIQSTESGTESGSTAPPPTVHALAGRSPWVDQICGRKDGPAIAQARDPQESSEVAAALALELTRRGHRCRLARMSELSLAAETPLDGDRKIERLLDDARREDDARPSSRLWVILLADAVDAWSLSLIDSAWHGASRAADGPTLLLVAHPAAVIPIRRKGTPWLGSAIERVPPLTRSALHSELRRTLLMGESPDDLAFEEFVDRVDHLASGSSGKVTEYLTRAASAGAFVRAPGGIRLSPTFPASSLVASGGHGATIPLDPEATKVLAFIDWAGRPVRRPALEAALAGKPCGPSLERVLARLIGGGYVVQRANGSISPAAPVNVRRWVPDSKSRKALHAAFVEGAAALGVPEEFQWAHGIASDPAERTRVEARVHGLRSSGLSARAARGLAHARHRLEQEGAPLPRSLERPLVMAVAEAGDARGAAQHAKALRRDDLQVLARAMAASLAGKRGESAEAYESIGALPQAHAERAHLAFETGDSKALAAELGKAKGSTDPGEELQDFETQRLAADMQGLRAMDAFRSGDPGRGLALLDGALGADPLPLLKASLLVNRSTLARQNGDLGAAEDNLREARRIYTELGLTAGIARAQSLLGGVLRESGQWLGAEESLVASMARRVRLPDTAALATTRASLGLVRVERGHLRAALGDLQWARDTLTGLGLLGPVPRIDQSIAFAGQLLEGTLLDGENPSTLGAACQAKVSAAREALTTGATSQELLALASDLREAGADGVACRLAIAALADQGDDGLDGSEREAAARWLRALLARVEAGLSPPERAAVLQHLLFAQDPAPRQLLDWDVTDDDDMDVLTVLRLNERLVNQENSGTLLQEIVQAGLDVTGAERGFLVMAQSGELMLDTAFLSSTGDVSDDIVEWSSSVTARALETGKPVRLADAVDDTDWGEMRSIESIGIRSILAVPFTVSESKSGVIVVDDRRRPGAFGPREERLLELLASQAALAIRQMERLEEIRVLTKELRGRVASQDTALRAARRALTESGTPAPIEGLVGDSKPMQAVRNLIHRVAPAEISVLISGPSGAGKEVAARAMHRLSTRAEGPFVSENCAAIPASLVESELFGSVKGSFTGADHDRAGLFERANGGTLFLDEIGELPAEAQAKLLRVLETRRVRRVGDADERTVDFRLLSATNRDLDAEVASGAFREDLLFRLDGVRIAMPSLSERPEDIAPLVRHLLSLESAERGDPIEISGAVLERLEARNWSGNVRELANEIRRLVVLSEGSISDPSLVRGDRQGMTAGASAPAVQTIAQLEKRAILDALDATEGDKRKTAELLGISRAKVYQRLKEWGIE